MTKMKSIYALSLANFIILCYLAWIKYKVDECLSCHRVPVLPINDITLAIIGALAALGVAIFYYGSFKLKFFKYFLLFYVILIIGFCSFLQMSQYIIYKDFCKLCFASALVFYIIFGLLIFDIILRPLNIKTDET